MIIGTGLDLLEVSRMAGDLQARDGLQNELFTTAEIEYCLSKRYPAEHFAARFCAKEALFKALGTGYRGGMSWREIEISNDSQGRPGLTITGKVKERADRLKVKSMHLSLTHTRKLAAGCVILEG
jgi:holo-[acyl-carrier protein] synthase